MIFDQLLFFCLSVFDFDLASLVIRNVSFQQTIVSFTFSWRSYPSPDTFIWYHNNETLTNATGKYTFREVRYDIQPFYFALGSSRLVIKNLTKDDAGDYYCYSRNSIAEKKHLVAIVNVLGMRLLMEMFQ